MRIGTGDRYEIMRNGRFMRYHNITHDDMLNGDGLRVVLWVAGCEHACEECQNPITWSPEGGIEFDCEAMDEIETELKKPHIAGITFSGGDPLHPSNIEKVRVDFRACPGEIFRQNDLAVYRVFVGGYRTGA